MPIRIEITTRKKAAEKWHKKVKQAQRSRTGPLEFPRRLSLPGGKIVEISGLPGSGKVDVAVEEYR